MEIIVLSVAKYKEKDAVITGISNTELVTFLARGIFSPKNKNAFLTVPFVKANITLIEGKIAHPILESASIISSPLKSDSSFEYMSVILTMSEAIMHLFEDFDKPRIYSYLDSSIESLKNGVDPYHVLTYFLLKILPTLGFEIEVNKCVLCGSKKSIVDFSFEEGGFLCYNCADSVEKKYSEDELKIIRNIIVSNSPSFISKFSPEESKKLLREISVFIYDGLGYRLKNLETLLK